MATPASCWGCGHEPLDVLAFLPAERVGGERQPVRMLLLPVALLAFAAAAQAFIDGAMCAVS
jgi:hypothetical protein